MPPPASETPGPAAPLKPLAAFTGSLSQRVYASLKEAILGLGLRPGEMLRKGAVCEALGVSRSPVSEAVARLAAEALVDVVPQAGTFVARLSMEEVREGAFLREALEVAAVEAVAGAMTAERAAELGLNMRRQAAAVEAGDRAGFYELDERFHEAILGFTGHRRLPALSRTAWVHVDRARRLLLPEPGRMRETLEEHAAILRALEAADAEGARAAMRAHLRAVVGRLEGLAVERPELFAQAGPG